MSLAKTLLKVAIGVAIVKGVSSMAKGRAEAEEAPAPKAGTPSSGRGTRFDGKAKGGAAPDVEDIMGDLLGTRKKNRATEARKDAKGDGDGLGDLLDQLSGTKKAAPRKSAPKAGMDDLLGQLTGKKADPVKKAAPGGVGDLLDQVLGGKAGSPKPMVLPEPQRDEELSAALLLRAMIQAIKADGELDAAEKARLMEAMGDAEPREVQAVNAELARPVDVEGLARMVPAGMEPQVYTVSLMAIDLDQQAEAQYLHSLAQALELTPQEVNALHDRAKVVRIYR